MALYGFEIRRARFGLLVSNTNDPISREGGG